MTQEERIALRNWEEFHKSFTSDMPVENGLSRRDIERRRQELEQDPIKWIQYFFPKYAKYEFAPFHVRAIRRIIEHDEWYEVLSWSRELAKSTVSMFILMYLALTGRKKFIVLASATITSATRLLTPFRLNFENNPRIKQFYGIQQLVGQWTETDFTCRCGAKFVALGAGSAPRGARNEAVRPDVIYLDDYDTDEDCRNPETLKKKWDWFEGALYPTRSISEPTLVLWCGNIIAKDCCIARAGAIAKSWDIVNIRDKSGKSTWPAKNTEEQINTVLAYSDSKKKGSSTKSLWLIGKYKGVYYIIKGFLDHETNANFIGWYFELDKYVGGKVPVYWYIENNKLQDPFYEQVFKPLLREEQQRRKTTLFIRSDGRKKADKATRIEANLEPIDRNCQWVFNEEEKDNPMMQELINQCKLFELNLPYPADGPDSLEGGITMLDEKMAEVEPTITISFHTMDEQNPYKM